MGALKSRYDTSITQCSCLDILCLWHHDDILFAHPKAAAAAAHVLPRLLIPSSTTSHPNPKLAPNRQAFKAREATLQAENSALQKQLRGSRERADSGASRRAMAEHEEEISSLELEVKRAQDQISSLETANMRLENENESLMAMEERVSSLTEENARLVALHAKAGDFEALEKERDEHLLKAKTRTPTPNTR